MESVRNHTGQRLFSGMDEELAEKVCGVVLGAANNTADTRITLADALGLCVVALALACDAGAQRAGASELRSRLSQTLVDALLEVGRHCCVASPAVLMHRNI